MTHDAEPLAEAAVAPEGKRKYQSPVLLTFGKVAALTRGTGCSATSDGALFCINLAMNMSTMASDRRLKEDVVRVGSHPLGIGLYLFRYKPEIRARWGHARQFGVMADEVEAVMPEAVRMHADGYRMVDYSMLGIARFVQ